MFSNIKVIIILGILFVSYFTYSQYRIDSLVEDRASISAELEQTTQTLENVREGIKIQKEFLRYSETQRQNATQQVRNLERTLADSSLEQLSVAKPGLIEKRVNEATKQFFNEVENETNIP